MNIVSRKLKSFFSLIIGIVLSILHVELELAVDVVEELPLGRGNPMVILLVVAVLALSISAQSTYLILVPVSASRRPVISPGRNDQVVEH